MSDVEIPPGELEEWLESLDGFIAASGAAPTEQLIARLVERARRAGVPVAASLETPQVNTIPAQRQPDFPGDLALERRIKSLVRWNAMAMVVRANRQAEGIGGHISTFASAATLYEVGFNHFFHGKDAGVDADQIYFQGHAAPGMYARAFLEGRLDEARVHNFRQELRDAPGPVVVPAPVAHARLLGVPHGVDGARTDHGHLPGALQSLPGRSRPEGEGRRARVGVPRRRRNRRTRVAGRPHAGVPCAARQPDLRGQLQSSATRRPGARQRADHPGAGGARSAAPAGTSSR